MMTQGRPLLRVQNVSKKYGRGREATLALNGVSLDIYAGELLAITGPSGSGKTTLSHIIGGLTTPDTGSIELEGSALRRRSDKALASYRNKKIGFVFQNFGLIPHYSACENIAMPLVIEGIPHTERLARAEHLLKAVGLEKKKDARAETLSGGEKQRVSIARALINKPQVIIADEPTGSLDSRRGVEIMAILERTVREQGVTVLMVTHDLHLAARADREVRLLDGQIVKDGQ